MVLWYKEGDIRLFTFTLYPLFALPMMKTLVWFWNDIMSNHLAPWSAFVFQFVIFFFLLVLGWQLV